jgi:hypothetical protein
MSGTESSDKAQLAVRAVLRSPEVTPTEAGSILMAELVNYAMRVPPHHRMAYAHRLADFLLECVRETLT